MSDKSWWWQGKRGEWYVVMQAALFLLLVAGPRNLPRLPAWPHALKVAAVLCGMALFVAGMALAFSGGFTLGRNLTPLPRPKNDAQLVETGPYRLVRHPIYGGIIIIAFGWALVVNGALTLLYAVVIFIFLDLKAGREEKWLREKFSGYDQYSKKARKFIPFIY